MPGEDFFDFAERMKRRTPRKTDSVKSDSAQPDSVPADSPAAAAAPPLTVTQLTAQIERALRENMPASVAVKGEVSNFKHHTGSGHLYFTLKDTGACIDCVMFRADAARLKFTPQDGMEILATGRISIYAQRGRYQLYVTRLEPLGAGALELAFRQLCAKLQAQGVFDAQRKKPIPLYPRRIALVTSTQTAAIADMFKVLRRFSFLRLMVYHVPVQGDGAAAKIAAAVADLNASAKTLGGIDVILLGRGGGSLEDLWQFNEEVVARAIVASRVPIVTGIGHEIDVSIADLAADHHAHTPTEAAQVVTANWRTAVDAVDGLGIRLRRELRNMLQESRQRLDRLSGNLIFRRPLDRVNMLRQLLDDRQRALALAMSNRLRRLTGSLQQFSARLEQNRPSAMLARLRDRLNQLQRRLALAQGQRLRSLSERYQRLVAALRERHPRHRVQLSGQRLGSLSRQLQRAMLQLHGQQLRRLASLSAHLNAVSPERVLQRGYSITTLKKGGAVVRSATQVHPGDRLVTRLADGTTQSVVEDMRQLRLFE